MGGLVGGKKSAPPPPTPVVADPMVLAKPDEQRIESGTRKDKAVRRRKYGVQREREPGERGDRILNAR